MIVLSDADIERAAKAAVWSAFANAGQVCVRAERVLVDRAIADRFTAAVVKATGALRLSNGAEADFDVGPLMEPARLAGLESQIADAVARGARIAAGGTRRPDLGPSAFAPTILTGCAPGMDVVERETFGPVLPIMEVDDAAQAVRLANSPPGGLSGSVWSRDEAAAVKIAAALETGSVCINDVLLNYLCVEAPLGGTAGSGIGFRHGPEALRQFCRLQTILEDRPLLRPVSAFVGRRIGFPYDTRLLGTLRALMRRVY